MFLNYKFITVKTRLYTISFKIEWDKHIDHLAENRAVKITREVISSKIDSMESITARSNHT